MSKFGRRSRAGKRDLLTGLIARNRQLLQGLRRSQSEGPGPQYHHSVRDPVHGVGAAAETGLMAAWVHGRRRHVTEQQRPEHWLISAPAVRNSCHLALVVLVRVSVRGFSARLFSS